MKPIEKLGPIPLYVKVRDWIKQQIKAGTWKANEKITAEAELSIQLGISRGTLKQAISHLIEEGLLIQIHGKGTFVVGNQMEHPLAEKLISIAEVLIENQQEFVTRFLGIHLIPAGEFAKALKVNTEEKIYKLQRIRYIEEIPVVYLENYLPERLFPNLEKYDFEKRSLFAIIEDEYKLNIATGKRSFMAKGVDDEIGLLLELAHGTPVTLLEQHIYDEKDMPLEYSTVWIRNDRIKLTSTLKR
jgi:DNA-binding GntR family transcriptional regulator